MLSTTLEDSMSLLIVFEIVPFWNASCSISSPSTEVAKWELWSCTDSWADGEMLGGEEVGLVAAPSTIVLLDVKWGKMVMRG